MNELHEYVTKLFSQIPETIESEKYKQKITQDMEKRYVSLIDIGIPEEETIKIVKGDFGYLKKDLKKGINDSNIIDEKSRIVDVDEVKRYILARKRSGIYIGVANTLLAVGLPSTLLFPELPLYAPLTAFLLFTFVFLLVAGGLRLHAFQSVQLEQYERYDDPYFLSNEAIHYIENKKRQYKKYYVINKTIGTLICLFAGFILLVGFALLSIVATFLGIILTLTFLGTAIMIFITNGNIWTGYQRLLFKPQNV